MTTIDKAYNLALEETIKGATMAFFVSSSISLVAHRYWPLYKNMTLPGKFMLISMATAGYAAFRGEHSLYKAARSLSSQAPKTEETLNKNENWLKSYRLELTSGILIGALGGCIWYLKNNKNRTIAQKITSTRLFTQGAVLLTVFGIIGLSKLFPQSNENDN